MWAGTRQGMAPGRAGACLHAHAACRAGAAAARTYACTQSMCRSRTYLQLTWREKISQGKSREGGKSWAAGLALHARARSWAAGLVLHARARTHAGLALQQRARRAQARTHAEKVPKQLHAENECTHARICNLLGEKRFRKARQVEGRGKILGGRAGAASARTVSCRAGDACGRMDAGRALLQQRARRAQAARTHTRMHAEQVSQHLHA